MDGPRVDRVPLALRVWGGHVAVAEASLQAGAAVKAKKDGGLTALQIAKSSVGAPVEGRERAIAIFEAAGGR